MNNRAIQRSSIRRQRGLVAVLVTLGFTFMLGYAGLAIDVNHLVLNKAKLQNAVDSAALAAATEAADSHDETKARNAALDALDKYDSAAGNTSLTLPSSVSDPVLTIHFSNDAETFPGTSFDSEGDVYVRVALTDYPLERYFLGLLGISKEVDVSAVAGPSSGGGAVCYMAPMAVCYLDSTKTNVDGDYYGFAAGSAYALKTPDNNKDIMGSGNFQYIDVGSGTSSLSDALAGNTDGSECVSQDDWVTSEPGNATAADKGLNTRFDEYQGNMGGTEGEYPSDIIISDITDMYDVQYDSSEDYEDWIQIYDSDTGDPVADPWGYDDYEQEVEACEAGTGSDCLMDGEEGRRVLLVPIIRCDGTETGASDYQVQGWGCFFMLGKAATNSGMPVMGEFLEECPYNYNAGSSGDSGETAGPYRIVLYKDPYGEGS